VPLPALSGPGAGFAVGTWLFVVVPVALFATMALWLTVVAHGGGRAALCCAVAAVATLPVYRVGLTLPLAGAALVLGRGTPEDDPAHVRAGVWAMVLAAGVVLGTAVQVALDAVGADTLAAESAVFSGASRRAGSPRGWPGRRCRR